MMNLSPSSRNQELPQTLWPLGSSQETLANCAEVVVKTTALCFSMPAISIMAAHQMAWATACQGCIEHVGNS